MKNYKRKYALSKSRFTTLYGPSTLGRSREIYSIDIFGLWVFYRDNKLTIIEIMQGEMAQSFREDSNALFATIINGGRSCFTYTFCNIIKL